MRAPSAAGTARRLLAVGATLLVAAVGLALPADAAPRRSASPATSLAPTFPPQRPTKVLVLGDSVMAGAATRYGPDLPGRDVTVDAVVNRTTGQGADVVAQRGADWDVVVVLLAHNDGSSPGVYQPAARRLLDQLANVPTVVWLTLHEVRPYYVTVNQFLRAEATRRRNLRVADWNAVASAHPEGLAGDGLHLNGRGAELLASLVAQQVAEVETARATFLRTLANNRLKARLRAAAAAFAAATTTTAPPTTTTEPDVGLIPPETLDQDPPAATTTQAPTTTEAATVTTEASGEAVGCTTDREQGKEVTDCAKEAASSDGGSPLPWILGGAGIVLLAAALVIIRRARGARATSEAPSA